MLGFHYFSFSPSQLIIPRKNFFPLFDLAIFERARNQGKEKKERKKREGHKLSDSSNIGHITHIHTHTDRQIDLKMTDTKKVGLGSLIIDNYKGSPTDDGAKKASGEEPFFYQAHQIHTHSVFEFIHSRLATKYDNASYKLNVCNWVKPQFVVKKVDSITASGLIGRHRKECAHEVVDIRKYSECTASGEEYRVERSATVAIPTGRGKRGWEKRVPSHRFLSRSFETSRSPNNAPLTLSDNSSQSSQGIPDSDPVKS